MPKKTDLPLIPLRGLTVFPSTTVNFDVGRKKSVKAVEEAVKNYNGKILLCRQKNVDEAAPSADGIYNVGVLARIVQVIANGSETLRVIVEGLRKIVVTGFSDDAEFITASYETAKELHARTVEAKAYRRKCMSVVEEHYFVGERATKEIYGVLSDSEEPVAFLYRTAHLMDIGDRQAFLEMDDVIEKYDVLLEFLENELEIAKVEKKINRKVRENIDKGQKEYYLREQIKAIQDELGDNDDEDLTGKVDKLPISDENKQKLKKDIERNAKMPVSSPDYAISRNYFDFVFELPWGVESEDNNDIENARKILDEDHYGLEKIKERILEFLAVRQLTDEKKEPIICLVGPPGVGKTSIVKSIARALNRKYVRMSLGGIRDEAEIRGHRKTYVGAMPGRIISSIKLAGTMNPVFLLDEIDKLASDFKGDPSSALLEVLDSEQNSAFRDNYLEIPFDLSKVIFIATANNPDTIPAPLYDRMEIIEMSGYTPEEKLEIAKRHLIGKQLKAHGITSDRLEFTDDAVYKIIYSYTRESGVRGLEKEIANVMRKVAVKIVEGSAPEKIVVTDKNLSDYLGVEKYGETEKPEHGEVGSATGLAWTAVGGEILTIEVSIVSGKGEILLTGHLGDVMKESARTAISYIHAHAKEFGIPEDAFKDKDIHIHVPEGAIPKDGPSAGITIATAVYSALTGKSVRNDVAMTGEITLRGKVLPIGGLKEKTLAAMRAGIDVVIIPEENKKDVAVLPESVKNSIRFVPVNNVMSVFENAMEN
ncbi:MAG: endopeptidase La [Eubacteriales bacterium]|nr:endopeptidase La [Christensenellaceae bacterium]MDY2750779.1 endopeptidase La [Eubacteriales bacterium]MDD6360776.1 endopeptidase La [Christensenellaceae bacterium]MDD7091980.1 endopeptidase La [Christensenellaceae bacterium]MDD7245979.1 endopeptidase La [Christensenellaceae bacterium]